MATVSFTSAVGLPIGSVVKVTFPGDFSVTATAISSVSNIDSSSTVAMASTYVVAVTVTGSAVSSGASVSFKLNGVTNPGAKTTGTFTVATTDSSSNIFQQSSTISAVTIAMSSYQEVGV
ncbi:hypothetical protein BBO99_00003532 [Phytophthora kernoviae]|uniref:Uncharacterized protein n=2 Tax=Phytophthora kernoviae TaxID=325452 RepID=A0A3R7JSP8_9STRA|nr:hypothetical protein G195_003978 [Phytophthora kernoviae 00238/432]KAG2527782.1 hypothetical protein JM16_003190 [Phytophthora kernoviae]KAG2529275.1 hypothetical protein JM18_002867 [Phytophthora kernoviae]RLN10319.1 hypothetical protein BBI17_003643 [Phytophthora kernoviae]RLN81682.1 hypothetical protein BBO99_00003532 [Phytophthora kernoviae]